MCSPYDAISNGISAPEVKLDTNPGRPHCLDHSSNAPLAQIES